MYPFGDRELRWFVRGKYGHLLEALRLDPPVLDEPYATSLGNRVKSLKLWNGVRGVVVVLLSVGALATAAAWVAQRAPSVVEVEATLVFVERLTAYAGASTSILTVVTLILTRLLNQIEADLLMLLRKEAREQPE